MFCTNDETNGGNEYGGSRDAFLRNGSWNDAEESFRETQIDGEMLIDMTMEDLEEMNVGLKLQRRRLLRLVKNTHEYIRTLACPRSKRGCEFRTSSKSCIQTLDLQRYVRAIL